MTPEMGRYTLQDDIARMAAHVADLDAHLKVIWDSIRTGVYIQTCGYSNSTMTLMADRLYAIPFIVPQTMTFDRIALSVTTGDAGKKVRLGIYNNGTNFYPGTRILAGAELDVSAIEVDAETINVQLTRGLYWLALLGNGTPIVRNFLGDRQSLPLGMNAAFTAWCVGWIVALGYATIPDPFTAAGGIIYYNDAPMVALRVASIP